MSRIVSSTNSDTCSYTKKVALLLCYECKYNTKTGFASVLRRFYLLLQVLNGCRAMYEL